MKSNTDRVIVQNIVSPGHTHAVDAKKYGAMKSALLKVVPNAAPGLTQVQMKAAVLGLLPDEHFPGGAKAGWWLKCVQLDLEAKRELVREESAKPLRWHSASLER